MGSIYRNAKHVISWLGEDDHDEALIAANFINELGKKIERSLPDYKKWMMSFLRNMACPQYLHEAALNHLMQLPYFRRRWIIQEVWLATSCALLWGSRGLASETSFH